MYVCVGAYMCVVREGNGRMTANRYRVSFLGDKNLLKLIMVMVV